METGNLNMVNKLQIWRKFANSKRQSLYIIHKEHLQFFKKSKYGQMLIKKKNEKIKGNKNGNKKYKYAIHFKSKIQMAKFSMAKTTY